MKKILLTTVLATALCIPLTYAIANPQPSSSYSQSNEQYERVAKDVSVYAISDNGEIRNVHAIRLYRGVNTCDGLYADDGVNGTKYPVRNNYDKQYRGYDVSPYNYKVKIGNCMYFFYY